MPNRGKIESTDVERIIRHSPQKEDFMNQVRKGVSVPLINSTEPMCVGGCLKNDFNKNRVPATTVKTVIAGALVIGDSAVVVFWRGFARTNFFWSAAKRAVSAR